MSKVTHSMIERRKLNLAASLTAALSYLGQVKPGDGYSILASANVAQALKDAYKLHDELHKAVWRGDREDRAAREKAGKR